jgi:dihydroorotate dehydrogenase subfamily 2
MSMQKYFVSISCAGYRYILRPICFLFDSEPIHNFFLDLGRLLGAMPGVSRVMDSFFGVSRPSLTTKLAGITLKNPIGLAAGFDHEAKLPAILSGLGFGFGSIGTVTNGVYGGNAYPRLKRLPKSRALLVNKGFKSSGIDAVLRRLEGVRMSAPVGISVGRTNTPQIATHEAAISDIVTTISKVIASSVPFSYIELNISCPNLATKVEFYEAEHLQPLLAAITALSIKKPLLIKMPIMLSDEATLLLIDTIRKFPVAAVIFGNLQKDRSHPSLDKEELEPLLQHRGNWSGMPCKDRSDELISLVYRHTRGELPIIGCGGVFTAEDAYRKITLGASAIQLATALVFEGPTVPAKIALGLDRLLIQGGYTHVDDAVGSAHQGADT